jgi:hypothetical protein
VNLMFKIPGLSPSFTLHGYSALRILTN